MKEVIKGTKEQRINRMTRMALEWQNDINDKKSVVKNSSYYFRKYHIGPYKVDLFSDIATANIDREWVIDKMNMCSAHKKILKENLEKRKANKLEQPSLFDNDIEYHVTPKVNDNVNTLSDYSDNELINELKNRNYKVIREY